MFFIFILSFFFLISAQIQLGTSNQSKQLPFQKLLFLNKHSGCLLVFYDNYEYTINISDPSHRFFYGFKFQTYDRKFEDRNWP